MTSQIATPLRSLAAMGLFALTLVAFMAATILAMFATAFSDQASLFFFDLLGRTFPIACPEDVPYTSCVALAHGWYENWSLLVWALVALAYGVAVRNRPLRQKLLLAAIIVPATVFLMHILMPLFGFQEFLDWI